MPNQRRSGSSKARRPADIRYNPPKDAEMYKLKRMYWLLMEYEHAMYKDVTKINMKDYIWLIKEYTDAVDMAKKKGKVEYKYVRKAQQGMDKQGVVSDKHQDDQATDSGERSSSLGNGVSPVNPLT